VRWHRFRLTRAGTGSNLQALIDATLIESTALPGAYISFVLSNRKAAYGLTRASTSNPPIPTAVSSLKTYQSKHPGATRDEYDVDLARIIIDAHDGRAPDLIVLAGFMHIVSPVFLAAMGHAGDGRSKAPAWAPARPVPIINLHPALPGAFDGAQAIERAFAAFQRGDIRSTGVMVHEVVAEVDRGSPVLVREVPIERDDTLASLEEKIHVLEHRLIVEGTRAMLDRPPVVPQTDHSEERNPWASTIRAKSPDKLPARPMAPTPDALPAPEPESSLRSPVSPGIVLGTTPPLSASAGSGTAPVPRARRRTLSRPNSVYGGGPALADLVEQPEAGGVSVAAAAARWGTAGAETGRETPRSRRGSGARPVTMYAGGPPIPQAPAASLTRSASVLKLESGARKLEALVNGTEISSSPLSPPAGPASMPFSRSPAPTSTLVQLAIPSQPALRFDLQSFVAAEARSMRSPRQATEKPRTVSLEMFSISSAGETTALRPDEYHIMHESELLALVHRHKSSDGLVATSVLVRVGRFAQPQGLALAKLQQLASRYAATPVYVPQGAETKELAETLGRPLISRQGSRAHWEEEGTTLYELRVEETLVTLEQVDLATSNLCSSFSYIASVLGSPFVWHGQGTAADERSIATSLLSDLYPNALPLEYLEGQEDEMFWAFFDSLTPYASASHHRHRPQLLARERLARLYEVGDAGVQRIETPSAHALSAQAVHVLAAPLETYVIVGADARGQRGAISLALDLAESLSSAAVQRRAAGSMRPPCHLVVQPSKAPRELRAQLRAWDYAPATASHTTPAPSLMNVVNASQARAELARAAFAPSDVAEPSFLPVGVHPSMLPSA
jgi:formyltetrahydrofolate-dependent phosphoribosylglycinamide formyltransferase